MALRRGHGTGAASPLRVEVPPADELRVADVPAPTAAPSGPVARRSDGKVDGADAAKELGRRGGLARAAKRARAEQFAARVRMATDVPVFEAHTFFSAYAEEAEAAFAALVTQLAEQSDGVVSAAVSSIARSAVQQTYAGRWIMDLGTGRALAFVDGPAGKPAPNAALILQSSRLLEAGRQSQLACFHLQQLEAEARAKSKGPGDAPWFVDSDDGKERRA